MRAGLAASGPRAAILRLQEYGFELQPTGATRAVTNAHVSRTACAGARLPGAPAFGS
jgi:hypothetical protein